MDTGEIHQTGFVQADLHPAFIIFALTAGQFTALYRGAGDGIEYGAFAAGVEPYQGNAQALGATKQRFLQGESEFLSGRIHGIGYSISVALSLRCE